MSLLQNSNAISAGGAYNITDSLRFRSSASAYLSRTLSASGTTNTWSFWIKRGKLGSTQSIFDWSDGVSTSFGIVFTSSDALDFYNYVIAYTMRLVTTQVFRDPSAWYHIVVVMDTTNATSSDRVKVYVNGNRLTSFSTATYPTQNLSLNIATSRAFDIGAVGTSHGQNFDGYMTEFNFIDGQALTPSDFGETNADGVWSPKKYTGTYGTNGFYLPMKETTQATGFNTVLWSGNGGTQSISNVGFSPDLVWVKARAGTDGNSYNLLYDTVRGAGKFLSSNTTNAETGNSGDLLGSFDSNGFSVNTSLTGGTNPSTSGSGTTFVGWCWDAGSSTVSNTDGTITSSVRANPASGFSVVTYTGNGTAGATIGHGLTSAPEMMIIKNRDNTSAWAVYHNSLGATQWLALSATSAAGTLSTIWNDTAPTSSVFSVGTAAAVNTSADKYVAYCFSEVAGYSKFGSYTGNGSTSGPTVNLGFSPSFVMVKRTDVADEWAMHDITRDPDGNVNLRLRAENSGAELTTQNINFTSTGFQVTSTSASHNASGGTYIYMAFADTRDFQWNFDASGNKNNWTPNNINSNASSEPTYDLMSDTPSLADEDTGNFCTWNPLRPNASMSYANGNLDAISSGGSGRSAYGTFGMSSGKWYFETTGGDNSVGVATIESSPYAIYTATGTYNINGTTTSGKATYTTSDIIGCAYDADANTIEFFKNGSSQGSTSYAAADGLPVVAQFNGIASATRTCVANFGQRPFKYTPPTGYKKLNTYNLPDSSITDGSQYFAPVTYTGNGTSQDITMDFSPDLVWIKERSSTSSHRLYDTIRGINTYLQSNTTDAEGTNAGNGLTAFNSDGFSLGTNTAVNESGITHISWSWRGSDSTAVSNTDGTITSTVSANTTSGFSVVTYVGTAAVATVGHGLGVAPSMIITKNRDTTTDWWVYHAALGNTKYIVLNTTAAAVTSSTAWNNTSPTSTVFTLGGAGNPSNANQDVAYCFAEVEGFSKFGSYTGNGSTDGPFIYTGFRPAFVMYKITSAAGGWVMLDTSRTTYNVTDKYLLANAADAEGTFNSIDILSNGFKVRNSDPSNNPNGGTVIYMAFAEVPTKLALAR